MIVLACSRPPVGAIATGIARGAYERVLGWLEEDRAARGLLERQHVQLALAGMEEEIHLARQLYMDAATELDHRALGGVMSHPSVRALGHVPGSIRRRAPVRGWLHSDRARDATVALLHRSTSERAVTRSLALSSMAKARGGDVAMRVTGAALARRSARRAGQGGSSRSCGATPSCARSTRAPTSSTASRSTADCAARRRSAVCRRCAESSSTSREVDHEHRHDRGARGAALDGARAGASRADAAGRRARRRQPGRTRQVLAPAGRARTRPCAARRAARRRRVGRSRPAGEHRGAGRRRWRHRDERAALQRRPGDTRR